MTSDFMQVRIAIVENRAGVLAEQSNSPLWMQIKPLPFRHAESLHFDTKAITFIFDHPDGPEVFNKIMTVEIKYHAFFHLLQEHMKAAQDAQNALSEKHPDPLQPRPVRDLVEALGFARVARMESLARGLFSHVDSNQRAYLEAADALPKLLKAIFKKGVVKLQPPTEEELKKTVV